MGSTRFPEFYEIVFHRSPIGSYLLSPSDDPIFLDVNDAFLVATSRRREDLIGKRLFSEFADDPADPQADATAALRRSIAEAIATGVPSTLPAQRYPIAVAACNGAVHFEERFWNAVNTPIRDAQGEVCCILHHTIDVTAQVRAENEARDYAEKVRRASLHDVLTGLPNRILLFEYAHHLLPQHARTGKQAAVLFLDLDRFKPINDTHGHEVGDRVLKQVAQRLLQKLRAGDIVTRLGGDEFVIMLSDLHSLADIAEVATHVIELIGEPYQVDDLRLLLSTSVGISIYPSDGDDIDTLISHADMAMYQAKQAGRNTLRFYSAEYAAVTRLQMLIERQLRVAMQDMAFRLHYQPVIDTASGEIVSVEALLRWNYSEVGPDRFVPVAEATGIIHQIGRWLLREASRQHRDWRSRGLPPIPIALNVSVVEFRDPDFSTRFEATIREEGIDAAALQLEVTETAVMDDVTHAVHMLSRLKQLGVSILLDDFGTGHSSLAYLARLPLSKVKIDRSFVLALDRDPASRTVTNAMIALGRSLGLEVVAEGVETFALYDGIRNLGCGQAQGHYLGKPMSGADFERWYRRRTQAGNG